MQANCYRGYSSDVQSVGDYGTYNGDPKTLEECMALCDETADCKSFVVDQLGGLKCHLKNECVDEDSPCIDDGSWNFINYYTENLCGSGSTSSTTTAVPTTTAGILSVNLVHDPRTLFMFIITWTDFVQMDQPKSNMF